LYPSPNIIRVIMSRIWAERGENFIEISVGKPKGTIPLRRSRRRWDDNIKTDLTELRYEGVGWIQLTEDGVHWGLL